ncbi:choline/ethanolamine kinase family protein [Clostridium bornimense]|uniref:Choline/ethanolamine kinase family protein n=1 Tax=Clostridium bornimense TaxID=1216932 RepID=W6RZ18_9CLOT|nr:phosphotransferase [Clostridium bornimense]CDM67277.1 choline/ethanolamine kinase family protein [Clostridium bornimense]
MNVAINNLLFSAFHNKCDISTIIPIGGLNNDNFKITYNNFNYFVRISSSSYIYNDINEETNILKKASDLNISPSVIYFDSSTRNLLMDWIDGRMPTEKESNSETFITLLTKKLKTLHSLTSTNVFNPFAEIRKIIFSNKDYFFNTVPYILDLLKNLDIIEAHVKNSYMEGLCHNDLNPSNILLTDKSLYIVDYEFAARGDIFFDLATIAWLLEDSSRKLLIKKYFGYYSEAYYDKLIKYIYVVKMYNGCWSLVKSLNNNKDYDFKTGAEVIFNELSHS